MEIAGETVGVAHQLVDIGDAKNALKQGKRVKNTSWGKDKKFIFEQVPSSVPSKFVEKMTSLPKSVKDYFQKTFESEKIDVIYYHNQIALVSDSNLISSYSFSNEDVLSKDWVILD